MSSKTYCMAGFPGPYDFFRAWHVASARALTNTAKQSWRAGDLSAAGPARQVIPGAPTDEH